MKINDILFGFRVTDVSDVSSIDAKMYLFEHERSGAKLCFLKRKDASRTFAITFPTPPTDDTGVFHILEHSVLCGSERFPTKEPFTELLKGSLNTFLNAMTYSDRTAYPVASRNDKDFYNLVNVYMDAVLHPLAAKEERIFRQEGWRYEAEQSGEISYNGVVYSEMKGVYSSADSLAAYHNARLLFPGGTYSYDSGGHPDAIPTLTYADFVAAHERHYHPSGAYMFLDGEPKLDEILPLLDSYLSGYERTDTSFEVKRGGDVITEPLYELYEIEEGEDPKDKTRLYLTYVTRPYDDQSAHLTLSIITDAISDSNDAPLKKAVLASGLCDNFYFYASPGCKWGTLNVEFRGVKDGRERALAEHFDSCIKKLLDEGIDKALLKASADRIEFKAREADFGSSPKGIIYLSAINDLWLYGVHPRVAIDYEESFRTLRQLIEGNYPTELLRDVLSTPRATLILTPSTDLSERREMATKAALERALSTMAEEDKLALADKTKDFISWQEREDSPEALATIPTLTLADLGDDPEEIPTIVSKIGVSTVIDHPIPTNGITYVDLYLDASDTPTEDIGALVFLGVVASSLSTDLGSANDFRRRAKSTLGAISISPVPIKYKDEPKLYLMLRFSSLDSEREAALRLAEEYLFKTKLDDPDAIRRMLVQYTALYNDVIIESGHSIAVSRAAAMHGRFEALKEYTNGYEFYRWLKEKKDGGDEAIDELIERMSSLRERIATKERATIAITGRTDAEFARACLAILPCGEPSAPSEINPLPKRNEGIAIPSQVSYAALAGNLFALGIKKRGGEWSTLATILDFEILWEEIRVKGGAYGTGFVCRANSGTTAFYSYRDPDPVRTLEVYRGAPDMLRTYLSGDFDLEKLIIGTVGASDPVSTPAADGNTATVLYLSGKSHADLVEARRETVASTPEALSKLADELEEVVKSATAAVVGPREALERLGLDAILEV